ncbi:MAG: hypothetical protein JRC68_07000 [Deltaproteobacteria bacterium]|nr:hypothetical protein [Deltaproteobacteria bacterium]
MELNNYNYVEDQDDIDALEEFAPKVREILRGYRKKRRLSAIATSLGFHAARLAEMINKDGNGSYKRRISPYYLAKFIEGGIMTVEEILDGRRLEDIPERPRMFFARMILSRKTINLVVEAQRRGINVDKLLETILYPKIVHKN